MELLQKKLPLTCAGESQLMSCCGKLDPEMLDKTTELLSIWCGDAGLTLSGLITVLPQEFGEGWQNLLPYIGECWLRLPPAVQRVDEWSPAFGELEAWRQFDVVNDRMRQIEAGQKELFPVGGELLQEPQTAAFLTVLYDIADRLLLFVLRDKVLAWAEKHMGSPAELVEFVTAEYGVEGRFTLQEALNLLRNQKISIVRGE